MAPEPIRGTLRSPVRPTLLLVHGAWHGSWCWERLVAPLAQRGLVARTIDLPSIHGAVAAQQQLAAPAPPSTGLVEDAAAVRATAAGIDGPVILCGHSYGGMVISLAASGSTRIARLVYLCAFVPDPGESLNAMGGGRPAPWIVLRQDGTCIPDPARAADLFYGDCDAPTQAWAMSRLRAQAARAFTEPVPAPAWQQIPASYIACTQDHALPLEMQRRLAQKVRESLELEASHSPFLSQPVPLADQLAGIADRL
jgi:pimeloyl-ACP methyl ester carboxylesterase